MNRDPKGHFCDRGQMLSAWLPLMLSWVYRERGLTEMLYVAIRHCETEAAVRLERNAKSLREGDPARLEPMSFRGVRQAEAWAARKMVLVEAIRKLGEIG